MIGLRRWLHARLRAVIAGREDRREHAVIAALRAHGPLSGAEVSAKADMASGTLYPTLMRLEQAGRITSDWAPGPYPRRRVYRLAGAAP